MSDSVKRGRPVTGQALTSAERKRLQRERLNLVPFTVDLPFDLVLRLDEYLKFKDLTRREVIIRLFENQLFRKR